MGKRQFERDLLGESTKYADRFTDKGRVKREFGGGWSFQIAPAGIVRNEPGRSWVEDDPNPTEALIWVVGPLGWWHDFQKVPVGLPFDEALERTTLPAYFGWLEQ